MKNTLITLMIGITLLSLVSSIYAGECATIEFPTEDDVTWNVEGNSTPLDGFSFTKDGTTIEYCFSGAFIPDSFNLIFASKINDEEGDCEECDDCDCGSRKTKIVYRDRDVIKYVDKTPVDFISTPINLDKPKNDTKTIIIDTIKKIKWYHYLIGLITFIVTILILFIIYTFFTTKEEEDLLNEEEEKDIPKEIVDKEIKKVNENKITTEEDFFKEINLKEDEDVTTKE